jgi:hypothetical protein
MNDGDTTQMQHLRRGRYIEWPRRRQWNRGENVCEVQERSHTLTVEETMTIPSSTRERISRPIIDSGQHLKWNKVVSFRYSRKTWKFT